MQCNVIALYIRLSVEDGDLSMGSKTESNSVAHQRMLLTEFIQSKPEFKNCRVIEFCDDGYTGTNFERPGFQQMMVQVKLKQIGCIIVKDLSRFGREYLDVSSYLELILPVFDIRFISVNDGFDSAEFAGTTGGMELAFRNLINGMYSRDISVKVKTARKTRERKGEYIGGHPFYGYLKDPADRHHLIVDEEARPVIERIFRLSADGISTMAIAKALNEEGILCPVELKRLRGIGYSKPLAEDKALWIQSSVRKIIRDERYTGKMVSNVRSSACVGKNIMVNNKKSDWIVVENTHEAIVSEELFQEANAALTGRVKTANQNTSWKNSGNLFVCGYCGRKLQKSSSKEVYLYCQKAKYIEDTACGGIREDLQSMQQKAVSILKYMGKTLTDSVAVKHPKGQSKKEHPEKQLKFLQEQHQKAKLEKRYLYEAYRERKLTKDEFVEKQSQHQEKNSELEKQLMELEKKISEMETCQEEKEQVRNELRTISDLKDYDAKLIGQIVEKIVVYGGGRMELVMKSQDVYSRIFQADIGVSA
ncbi:MAG: recombinase family protein [Lachnospiraceae bacterium]|nr:recombinase family protein [Lachnospiraceae bacterium]